MRTVSGRSRRILTICKGGPPFGREVPVVTYGSRTIPYLRLQYQPVSKSGLENCRSQEGSALAKSTVVRKREVWQSEAARKRFDPELLQPQQDAPKPL